MSESKTLTADQTRFEPREDLDKVQRNAWIVAALGAVVLAFGYATADRAEFLRAYLIGWLFTLGIAMGLSALNMLNHHSGGYWGVSLRRVMEASGRTLIFLLILAVPIFLGVDELYHHWAHPDPDDALLAHKAPLLNKNMFIGCSVVILMIWWALAMRLSGLSHRYDESGDEAFKVSMQKWSAIGIITYVLSGTLASVLWIMSFDPHWFSSLFGVAFVAGQALSAFAFIIPTLIFLSRRKPFIEIPAKLMTKLFHDFGKLMLAFTALWAYFMMSQFLIIWSGNLPEEVTWYLDRSSHGWQWMSIALVFGHFVFPFILLLSQDLKKTPGRLVWVAGWMLLMRFFDLFWQVAPSASHDHVVIPWLDFVAAVTLASLWLGLLVAQVKNRALLPVGEPVLKEVLAHG